VKPWSEVLKSLATEKGREKQRKAVLSFSFFSAFLCG